MKIKEIFKIAIETGIDNDPRGRINVEKSLLKRQEEFLDLPKRKQAEYDKEKFTNPYSDSALHFGDPEKEVKTVLIGIDIDSSEVLLCKELERQGRKIDLILGHHPIGKSLATLHEVMDLNTEVLVRAGMPENVAEKVLADRLGEVERAVSPINHYKPIDTAKLLGLPIMNIHTPADNAVWKFVSDLLESEKPQTLGEIVEILKKIPEYKKAAQMNAGPMIFSGSEKSRAGKVIVSGMTGGTSGSEKVYERMSHYGIGTEIAMHIKEKDRDEAMKHFINVVVAGHMASDSLGLNLIADKLEKKGIEVVPCSGFIRYKRK